MNKQLSSFEVAELVATKPMTKREKLSRWAQLVRDAGYDLYIFDSLEDHSARAWDTMSHTGSAFAVAYRDPILREAGLKGDSVGDGQRFFELTRDDIHAFSCNCGGAISNAQMADRIEKMAA